MDDSLQGRLVFPAGSQSVATSEDAADALTPDELNARRVRVLHLFADARDHGATADEIVAVCARGYQGGHNKWAPRVTELLRLGLLMKLDGKQGRERRRRRTRQGGTAFVHVISSAGLRFLDRGGHA